MSKKKSQNSKNKSHILQKSKKATLPKPSVSYDELRKKAQEEYEKKKLRKQIKDDYYSLIKSGNSDLEEVAKFITKYSSATQLVREALSDQKYQKNYFSKLIWDQLLGSIDENLEKELLVQKMSNERKEWISKILPSPLIYNISALESGPNFADVTPQEITRFILSFMDEYHEEVSVIGNFPFKYIGDYTIKIVFQDGINIEHTLSLRLHQDPLPDRIESRLKNIDPIYIDSADDPMGTLQKMHDEESPNDILNYYPLLGRILITAYQLGFWKTNWVQNLFHEWENRTGEFVLNSQINTLKAAIDEIESIDNFIPFDLDNDNLDVSKVEAIALELIEQRLSYPISNLRAKCLETSLIDLATVNIEIRIDNLPAGRLHLRRTSFFLPQFIRDEISESNFEKLLMELRRIQSSSDLIIAADRETRIGISFQIDSDSISNMTRSTYLGTICRVLIERGLIGDDQMKSTLTSFYAARGQELLDDLPLQARKYFLLFYRMMFKENANEHIKATRPFDYPVLSNIFTSYLTNENLKKRSPRDTGIKGMKDLKYQLPLLWRAAQLLNESPINFLAALFEMYVIDENFVRSLIGNLRKCEKIDRYDLNYLNPDKSTDLYDDIVIFLIKHSPTNTKSDDLVNFTLSLLDSRNIAHPIFNSLSEIIKSVQTFISTKDIVQRSTIYTEIDRQFLQIKSSLDQLVTEFRRNPDERKKASHIMQLLNSLKEHVDSIHREFFRTARLEAVVESTTLPRDTISPVEIVIENIEFGLANNVNIVLERDTRFLAETYEKSIKQLFANEKRIEFINITPLTDQTLEFRGRVIYTDQEGEKWCPFQQAISVSDPEKFQYFNSPYITGKPVFATEMFFGRRKELGELIQLLMGQYQDKVIAIWGNRRVGKTSLLVQLQTGNPELLKVPTLSNLRESYIPIIIDFERFAPTTQAYLIYHKICTEIYRKISDIELFPLEEIPIEVFDKYPADTLIDDFMYKVIRGLKSSNKKVLLLMDEFDNLIKIGGEEKGIFGFIRELINKYNDNIGFIFVGADEMVEMMRKYANRLYSMANTLEIPNLSEEDARRLILEPMKRSNPQFIWPENAVKQIINLTDKHPYYIQVLCDSIVQVLIRGKRLRVTTVDVQNMAHKLSTDRGSELFGELSKMFTSLKTPAKIVLTAIANLTTTEQIDKSWVTSGLVEQEIQKYSERFPAALIIGVLLELKEKNILLYRGGNDAEMEYSFRVPLLRFHVSEHLKMRDLLKEAELI